MIHAKDKDTGCMKVKRSEGECIEGKRRVKKLKTTYLLFILTRWVAVRSEKPCWKANFMNCINFLLISKASVIQLSRKHRLFVSTRCKHFFSHNRTAYLHSQVWLTRHFSAWSEALQVYSLFSLSCLFLLFTLVCFTHRSSLHFLNLDLANALFFPAKSYQSNANFSLINSKHQLGGSIEWAYLHFLLFFLLKTSDLDRDDFVPWGPNLETYELSSIWKGT